MVVADNESQADHVLREFRDRSLPVQFGLGVAAALGLLAVFGIFRLWLAGQVALCVTATAGLALVGLGLGLAYIWFGRPIALQQLADGLALRRGDDVTIIPFERLVAFSAAWRDIYRNGVYQNTLVRFCFENAAGQEFRHSSFATDETQKYKDLQQFQSDISATVAEHLRAEIHDRGRVRWTDRVSLLEDGIEFRKRAEGDARLVEFSRITYCEIDQGLLKLAIDRSAKPNIVEKTGGRNFFPGLILFEQLADQAAHRSVLDQELQLTGVS